MFNKIKIKRILILVFYVFSIIVLLEGAILVFSKCLGLGGCLPSISSHTGECSIDFLLYVPTAEDVYVIEDKVNIAWDALIYDKKWKDKVSDFSSERNELKYKDINLLFFGCSYSDLTRNEMTSFLNLTQKLKDVIESHTTKAPPR